VALKDLVSDLSNYKGQTNPDTIDNQIKKGVDFFPNTDAPGFTPKTDLESLYNKVKDGNLGPVGGNVSKYASLLAGQQSSQFSFPNGDRQNNIEINPEGFSGLKTTFDLPRESFRFTTLGPENDTFKPLFSSLGLGSSHFTNQIDLFHRYESSEFTNLPGLGNDNNFFNRSLGSGGSFRQVSDPVGLTHPIILRPFGSNWKNANTDLQIANLTIPQVELKFGDTLGLEGVSLTDMASRNIADNARILRWSLTPQGANFITKQRSLQRMNPTIETKTFNDKSILGVTGGLSDTVLPIYHPERHVGGLASRYENVLGLTGFNPTPGIQLTGGSRLAYQSRAFTIPKPPPTVETSSPLFNSIANFAISTASLIYDALKIPINIGLSNPNKYNLFPSSAPVSTKFGFVSFGTGAAQVAVDSLLVRFKKGGNFNKSTAEKGKPGDLIRHKTLPYGALHKDFVKYEQKTTKIVKDVGSPGSDRTLKLSNDSELGSFKGNLKSSNVDKVNALRYPFDYKLSPENPNLKDFIKFRFKDVINGRYIIFRAILDGISDAIVPDYGEEKYIGRPDKVYVYKGADRTVNFNFSIYPKTKQEFPILMNKLNHLVGLCYPTYTPQEMMVTPFIELTLGDMFVDTSGILSGLTITVEDQSTWEIDEGLQFPHFIKAACEFKYIGNNKLSSVSTNHYNGLRYQPPTTQDSFETRRTDEISNQETPLNIPIEPVAVPYLPEGIAADGSADLSRIQSRFQSLSNRNINNEI